MSTPRTLSRGPSLEVGLYILLVLIAGGLRLWDLGGRPLSLQEADIAHRAWVFYQGQSPEADPGLQPVLFQATLLTYLLLGASDAVVRLAPALMGTGMVAACYLLRRPLGRWAALAVVSYLAFSPTAIFYSRYLDGQILAGIGSLLLIAGIFGYWEEKSPSNLYVVATGCALTILAVGLLSPMLLALAIFPLLYGLAYILRRGHFPEVRGLVSNYLPATRVLTRAGLILLGMLLLLPTGGFLVPEGLQAMVEGLVARPGVPPSASPLFLLLGYEPLILFLGILGGLFLAAKDGRALFVLVWLGLALLMGQAADPLSLAMPLTILSGMFIENLRLQKEARVGDWERLLAFSSPILLYIVVQWTGYAASGDTRHLFLLLLALGIISGLVALFGLWQGWGVAAQGGLFVVLIFGGWITLHNTARLAYSDLSSSPEYLLAQVTSPDVRNLVDSLKNFSNQTTGERYALEIATTVQDPVLFWYLRDFRHLRHLTPSQVSLASGAIITGEGEVPGEGYFGQRFTLRLRWPVPSPSFRDFSRWLLFREVGVLPEASGIIIWRPAAR